MIGHRYLPWGLKQTNRQCSQRTLGLLILIELKTENSS
uniref:Uncharacterized protein n=1 Tax=Anguilla anguilla TaxID=7936 RepID=A0A0E9VKN4_ANGAN